MFDNSNTLIIYSWELGIGSWEFRGWERKLINQNSDALPSDTIFAFLMLNTMSSAHDKIFGEKFSSFERFELIRLRTVGYVIFWRNIMKSDSQKSRFFSAIEPLLHSNTVAVGTQKSLFCAPIAALSSVKEALSLNMGAVCTAKHRKNSQPELYNQFLFCNRFLPFRQYLHSGQ